MKGEMEDLGRLRRVLESAAQGRGLARSTVEEMRGGSRESVEAARRVLLGGDLDQAITPLTRGPSEEVAMMASLIPEMARSTPEKVGRGVERLSSTIERWVRLNQGRRAEWKVQEFRGLLTCGVLGAVAAALSSLGPLMGTLSFGSPAPAVDGGALSLTSALMAVNGASMLGFYLSGKRMIFNAGVCLVAFGLVAALVSPLADLQPAALWGG